MKEVGHITAATKRIMGRFGGVVFLWGLIFSTQLQAQSSRIELDLFGLKAFSLKSVPCYTYRFNAYGDSWDSYQEIFFAKTSSPLGAGGGLTYWVSDRVGLRLHVQTWTSQRTSTDNSVLIHYSYYPWYPSPSPDPVVVSYGLKSPVPPALSYRIGALSFDGVLRAGFGRLKLDLYGGLTVFQVGGDLQDIYFKRIIPSSHMTFLSEEVRYTNRFDFAQLGANLGLDLSVPLGGNFEALAGLKYFIGSGKQPDLRVASMADTDDYFWSVVFKGVDDIKEYVRYGNLPIDPSMFSFNLGLRYKVPARVGPPPGWGRFSFLFLPGAARMNPEIGFARTVLTAENGARKLEQTVEVFNHRLLWSWGGGVGFRFSPRWAAELSFERWHKELDVDSSPVVLIQDQKWRSKINGQRPLCRSTGEEFGLSVIRFFPVAGGEVLVSAGACLARLSLTMDDLYFLYWHKPWTDDFVSYSGVYSASGRRWILGASFGLGGQFTVAGPLAVRLMGRYFIYPTASIPAEVQMITLDQEVYGSGERTGLRPEELQAKLSPQEMDFRPSRIQFTCGLLIRF
ncbi:MAG: hypothetical protein OEW05_05615 [Candidatus Aminicenantes bacterium]|nr:hypothetical protein [Candidatus Aminicenantes bacterium]